MSKKISTESNLSTTRTVVLYQSKIRKLVFNLKIWLLLKVNVIKLLNGIMRIEHLYTKAAFFCMNYMNFILEVPHYFYIKPAVSFQLKSTIICSISIWE